MNDCALWLFDNVLKQICTILEMCFDIKDKRCDGRS